MFIRCNECPYDTGKHKSDIGIFYDRRYFTVTGTVWGNAPSEIKEYPVELIRDVCAPFVNTNTTAAVRPVTFARPDLTDDEVIEIAARASNGAKFVSLMGGDVSGYPSGSEADSALATILAFYTGGDEHQIERIMRSSNLVRDKWAKNTTYLSRTISRACDVTTTYYEPPELYGDPEEGQAIVNGLFANQTKELTTIATVDAAFIEKCERVRERHLLPKFPELDPGLFKDYMEFGKSTTYSIPDFHFAALLPIIAMVVGRRASINIAMSKLYCNVFPLVVGRSTVSGKSVACNLAARTFRGIVEVEEEMSVNNSVGIWDGTVSDAAVVQQLSDVWNALWVYDDCGGFFEDALGWNATSLQTLCKIYDCGEVSRTLSGRNKDNQKHKWTCPQPFVSLLWNTTIKNIDDVACSKMMDSGFFPRVMWFIGEGGKIRENHEPTPGEEAEIERIKSQVQHLRDGFYSIPPDGVRFGINSEIEKWRITSDERCEDNELYGAAIGRAFIHAYKIAMILSVVDPEVQREIFNQTDYPVRIKIPDRHAKKALEIVEQYLLPRAVRVANASVSNDTKNHQIIVLKALERNGGVATRTELLRKTRLGRKEFDASVNTLVDAEEIQVELRRVPEANNKPAMFIIKL